MLLSFCQIFLRFSAVTTIKPPPRSPDGPVHHKVDRGASWELADGALLDRSVHFDLPHVSVASVLVVGQDRDLDHEGADRLVRPLV